MLSIFKMLMINPSINLLNNLLVIIFFYTSQEYLVSAILNEFKNSNIKLWHKNIQAKAMSFKISKSIKQFIRLSFSNLNVKLLNYRMDGVLMINLSINLLNNLLLIIFFLHIVGITCKLNSNLNSINLTSNRGKFSFKIYQSVQMDKEYNLYYCIFCI